MTSTFDEDRDNRLSVPPSPRNALVILTSEVDTADNPAWRAILSDSHQVVLYNSSSHALTVRPHSDAPGLPSHGTCPYCSRPLDDDKPPLQFNGFTEAPEMSRASNYFQLLEIANETSSRPSSGLKRSRLGGGARPDGAGSSFSKRDGPAFSVESMAEGYFSAFFKEEYRLGMGANGSVFLCQHVLDGNPLGHFAVKKVAVGQSHKYLLQILKEVKLLEKLRHPNIITYHHAWLESYQFSSFGPRVPTLFILMQWAEGGSLDDFIEARLGRKQDTRSDSLPVDPLNPSDNDIRTRSDRIRSFKAARSRPQEEIEKLRAERSRGTRKAIHLLSAEETKRLFSDVVSGLSFLHDKSLLHLDLKPGNVLLTWEDNILIPRAMLSDFGTSRDMLHSPDKRSGNTGTLEYTAPETLRSPRTGLLMQVDSKADMWSLGMILHMLLFFRLPYHYSSDGDRRSNDGGDIGRLEQEVLNYPGFRRHYQMSNLFERRGLPSSYLLLLESLLSRTPKNRPSSEQVLRAIREGKFDPQPLRFAEDVGNGTLVARASPASYLESEEDLYSGVVTVDEDITFKEDLELDGSSSARPGSKSEVDNPTIVSSSEKDDSRATKTPLVSFSPTSQSNQRKISKTLPTIIRSIKSGILIWKVLNLLSLCSNGQPEPIFMSIMLIIAVIDVWSDGLRFSLLLLSIHVLITRLYCFGSPSRCCI